MILDKNLLMSNAQAVTATAASTDVIDLGLAYDLGNGDDIEVICQVGTAFTAGGAATMTVAVQGSVDNSTFFDLMLTRAIPVASLTAGSEPCRYRIPSPGAGQVLPRFIRMNYTIATGPMTAGTITAGLALTRQNNRAYPPGVTVVN